MPSVLVVFLGLFLLASCRKEKASETAVSLQTPEPVVELATHRSLKGQVILDGAKDFSGILVFCAGTSHIAYTDEEGYFLIPDVPVGQVTVMAKYDGYRTGKIADLTVGAVPLDEAKEPVKVPMLNLEKIREEVVAPVGTPSSYGSVEGRVFLEGESDLAGVVVEAANTDFRTVTDERGNFRLINLEPTSYTLVLKKQGYDSLSIGLSLQPGEQRNLEPVSLKLTSPVSGTSRLEGVVELIDSQGKLLEAKGREITVALENTPFDAVANDKGEFVFGEVPPGRYNVTAYSAGFQLRGPSRVDLVQNKDLNITLVLQTPTAPEAPKGMLKGRVLRQDVPSDRGHSGITVGLAGTDLTALTDAYGNFRFEEIPEGEYTLLAQAESYEQAEVDGVKVKGGEESSVPDMEIVKSVTYPEVIFTDPDDGDRQVIIRRTVPVFIRFSKKMRVETVKRAFQVTPEVDYRLYMGRQHPQSDFDLLYVEMRGISDYNPMKFDTRYSITISTEATDFEGISLKEPYNFSFVTAKAAIIETQPKEGEDRVTLGQQFPLIFYFNAPIRHDTLDSRTIRVSPELYGGFQVAAQENRASGWTEVRIFGEWKDDTQYTIVFTRGIRTFDGSGLSNTPFRLSFRTAKRIPHEAPYSSSSSRR
ncbi:MAG: carboxypeptidase-like regulatory domain-containing protein [bacterium]